jgi:hypothetical protein
MDRVRAPSRGRRENTRGAGERDNDRDNDSSESDGESESSDEAPATRRAIVPVILTVDDARTVKAIAQYCCVVKLERSDVEVAPFRAGSTWKPAAPSNAQILRVVDAIVEEERRFARFAFLRDEALKSFLERIVEGAHGSVRAAVNALQFELRAPVRVPLLKPVPGPGHVPRGAEDGQGNEDADAGPHTDSVVDIPGAASYVCFGGRTLAFAAASASFSPADAAARDARALQHVVNAFGVEDAEAVFQLSARAAPQASASLEVISRALDCASLADVAFYAVRARMAWELAPNAIALGTWGVGTALRTEPYARMGAGTANDGRLGVKPLELYQMWGAAAKLSAATRRWRLVGAATAPPAPGLSLAARVLLCQPFALAEDHSAAQARADAELVCAAPGGAARAELTRRVCSARQRADKTEASEGRKRKRKRRGSQGAGANNDDDDDAAPRASSLLATADLPPHYPASAAVLTTPLVIFERTQVLRARAAALLQHCTLKPTQHIQRRALLETHGLYVAEDAARALLMDAPFAVLASAPSFSVDQVEQAVREWHEQRERQGERQGELEKL